MDAERSNVRLESAERQVSVRASDGSRVLIVMAGERACALPLQHVAEIMRPLSIEPVAGAPGFVRGVSVIRGAPTPVIDLDALLSNGENDAAYGRFVSMKVEERRVALGVTAVVGLAELEPAQLLDLPPILRDVAADLIEAIGTRDAQLLVVLRAARLVPEEAWLALSEAESAR